MWSGGKARDGDIRGLPITILIADGLLELEVLESDGTKVLCKARNTGTIGSKKNVNLVGLHAMLPIMSEQDKADIAFGVQQEVDFIAASFVSFASPAESTAVSRHRKTPVKITKINIHKHREGRESKTIILS